MLIALLIGLSSTLHCLGMCGGIIGSLSISLSTEIRNNKRALLLYSLTYSLGRLLSYSLAGLLVGLLSYPLQQWGAPASLGVILRVVAALLLIAIGLYLGGWLPHFSRIEKLGQPLWQKLSPLSRRLLPVQSLPKAFLFGLMWGWLPCGLVYSTLIYALTQPDPQQAALVMLGFGIGTLPGVISAGLLSHWLNRLRQQPLFRQGVGLILIISGLINLWLNLPSA